MSADAKAWQDEDGRWHAIHDGDCKVPDGHHGTSFDLVEILTEVQTCMDCPHGMRWVLFAYTNGLGLKGYIC